MEVEFGRCPLCGRAMSDRVKHVTLRDKILEFPYYLHWCPYHGYFIWRGRKGYELADFSKIEREAISVKPKPRCEGSLYRDYSIVRMKCPYCGFKWKQYKDTPPNSWGNIIVCPSCKSEISKEKAMLK